jgi:DNA-binding NarL/FixJ family response regulator
LRLRPAHARQPRPGTAGPPADSGAARDQRVLAVAVVGTAGDLEQRLRSVASTAGSFELVVCAEPDPWGSVAQLPAATDVVVLALEDGARSLAALRELRRANPAWRLVVVASSTAWFEEAFELGADAWVDRTADDRTIELAVTGERLVRDRRRRTTA